MSEVFSPDEVRVLKALAAGLLNAGNSGGGPSSPAGAEASDSECLAPFGDPTVRKMPKRWAGEDYTGRTYSQTTPEFLDCLAESNEYFARLDAAKPDPPKHKNGTPWHVYNTKDSRLARGWSRRLRAANASPSSAAAPVARPKPSPAPVAAPDRGDAYEDESEIPF